ncbi:hypothetical protein MPSEU_000828700 [Mayamaea pseudoterrestris]|nr:hypothetical protein MPSEU_000828700 [Mayamaea pseudoterrestris]
MLRTRLLVTLAVIISSITIATAEDVAEGDDITQDVIETTTDFDTAIIVSFALLCALLLSLFGILLGYFSVKEDLLLRRYLRDGILIRAAVDSRSIQYTRQFGSQTQCRPSCCSSTSNDTDCCPEAECYVVIEYKTFDEASPQAFYKRVRKRVRTLASDFVETSGWKPPTTRLPIVTMQFDLTQVSFEGPVPAHDETMLDGLLELQVLQLPQHKRSGLPLEQVHRACRWSHVMPTICMVLAMILFAAFCIYIAIDMVVTSIMEKKNEGDDDNESIDIVVWTSAIVSVLLTFEILLVRTCGEAYMNAALHHEYLDGGEMLLDYGDSASLSSGDDSFL